MTDGYRFHPEALAEYREAADYYFREASQEVADGFLDVVETAVAGFVAAPILWRVVEPVEVRRCVLKRFPYVVYYRWEARLVIIYAVMHGKREPGYWRHRLDPLTDAPL